MAFSEITRIEAAIRNGNAKELEWSLWYCRMRQGVPSALRAHVKYWAEMEAKVQVALEPVVEAARYRVKKKSAVRGLGLGPVKDAPKSAIE